MQFNLKDVMISRLNKMKSTFFCFNVQRVLHFCKNCTAATKITLY